MEASIVLEVSKKAWDLAHLAGGSVIKNDAGEKYFPRSQAPAWECI